MRSTPSLLDEMKGLGARVFVAGTLLIVGIAVLRLWLVPSLAAPAAGTDPLLQDRLSRIAVQATRVDDGRHVVVVDLAGAQVGEAQEIICREAEREFRRSLSGVDVYVRRGRGSLPADDAGVIVC